MPAYALTIFIGAFLLFQVQPLIGKYVLPWFGGSTEVWTVCMLFFQTMLLAGYGYAHLSVRLLSTRMQAMVHVALLAAAIAVLPIVPADRWAPTGPENPTLHILLLLGATIGLPYLVLSATSPLMQSWFSRTRGGAMPYRLYALSNAGSLLALVSYPFVFEPLLTRAQQAMVWSASLGLFAAAGVVCAIGMWRHGRSTQSSGVAQPVPADHEPSRSSWLLWLALPAGAVVVLLAVTNKVCLDVAPIPFLWVLPLSLYLLSFIICFDNQRWYARRFFLGAFVLSLVAVIYIRTHERDLPMAGQVAVYCAALFTCCMVCHGELFRLRPEPGRLTGYYLTISAGGALGGFFVAIIAPLLFSNYVELYLGLLACCMFALLADSSEKVRRRRWLWACITAAGAVALMLPTPPGSNQKLAGQWRNFYGVLTLWDNWPNDPDQRRLVMQHGTTFHGLQFVDAARRRLPTAYYGPDGGAGLTLKHFPRHTQGLRVGVIGLGAGTLAAYGQPGDVIRFYEINPQVVTLAQSRFAYLADSQAQIQTVLGDGRLSLQRETPQQLDVLVLDAFSSDAIPVHLLTAEAFEVYLRHLKPDGVLAAHVSNCHLDLKPVLLRLAHHHGLRAHHVQSLPDDQAGLFASSWVLLTNNQQFLETPEIRQAASEIDGQPASLWTDDHVNLLETLN